VLEMVAEGAAREARQADGAVVGLFAGCAVAGVVVPAGQAVVCE
jgi:hypothetical protein